ncbi:protease [Xanthomonas translucens pv. poae]|uniref:Protease n=1 Tax=Xanthomonas graminis pv. poae TaxID=227946 RepID=A0A0K3A3C6_9XANT|nr:S8 family serine peptidase [Xanthomonas translucens]UKE61877.1 S8 family serine peptidase [Xanthomonas translucens pv. poae]CTP90949.1 protease [Xanthomonas translucens pv. poae]
MISSDKLATALAAVLAAGSAHAATPAIGLGGVHDVVAQSAQTAELGQRFIVKTGASGSQARRLLDGTLSSAVSRSSMQQARAASADLPARGAVSASVLREMAVPGWHVVQTSRRLSDSERAAFIAELMADPSVQSVQVDRLYHILDGASVAMPGATDAAASTTPNDPAYARLQWNFHDPVGGVNAEQAWTRVTGKGVVVAVVDTGVVKDNPDLAANVLPGYDMITDHRISRRDSDARVPGGFDLGDWTDADYCTALGAPGNAARNSSWHGSHVSGTIAQVTNNNLATAGLAHDAKIVPVRVLGACGGFGSDIADGMLWAAGLPVDGMPANPNPAEVINMSLGSGGPVSCPQLYQDAIDKINAAGSIVVVAAGNANADAGTYTMSSCNGVISVGATRINGGRASYSSYGTRVDIAAPGGGGDIDGNPNGYIFQVINAGSQRPTGDWEIRGMIGTSMASPHVAAAVAMVQSAVRTPLTWSGMRDLLRASARPFPVAIPTSTPIGAGILDLDMLLQMATTPPCDPADSSCVPPSKALTNKVELRNLGSQGGDALYSFQADAGKPLSFMTFGGSGNVALYAAAGKTPSSSSYDARSVRAGTTQTIRFTPSSAGIYYLRLSGSYSGLTLVGRQ